jgi:hypothetical protein
MAKPLPNGVVEFGELKYEECGDGDATRYVCVCVRLSAPACNVSVDLHYRPIVPTYTTDLQRRPIVSAFGADLPHRP